MKIITLTAAASFLIVQPAVAGKDVTFLKGDNSIFNGDASFLIEFDLSNTSIDGLDTEEAFVEYKKTQKEDDAEKWESGWNTDKGNFPTYFSEAIVRGTKNTRLKFSIDDPDSKYKMIVRPVHIETGTPMKYSSTELKLHVIDMATNEEVAVIYIPPSRGAQMGPMTPTVGMRVNYALYGSASMLSGYIKKMLKDKVKKSTLALFIIVCAFARASAQADEGRVHNAGSVVFFGMDFTFLKLIHEDGFIDKNGKPMCKTLPFKYFGDWNDMFLIEKEKFNMTRYFAIPSSTVDLAIVTERNKAYATDACIIEDESYAITPADITATAALYAGKGGEGLGCVIIVESMNKTAGRCIFYTVFFDVKDGTLVKLERNEGSPVGYGFRNYWINAIDNGLDAVSNSYYKARKGTK